MKKLVVFSKQIYPGGSGGALATYLAIKYVLSKYFNITLVSGVEKPDKYILKNTNYIYWPLLKIKSKLKLWSSLFSSRNILNKLVKHGDIFYITSGKLIPLIPILKRIKKDSKIIVHLHGYQPLNFTSVMYPDIKAGLKSDLYTELLEYNSTSRAVATGFIRNINYINRLYLRNADKIICVSKRMYDIINRNLLELRDRSIYIYNLLPEVKFVGKEYNIDSLVYIGGGSFIKGIHIVLKSYLRLIKRGWNLNLILNKNYPSKLVSIIWELNKLGGKCIIKGQLSRENLINQYSRVYALLYPSLVEESFGYGVAEAMLAGTIPIASRVGGVPEIVSGTFAEKMLFKPGDINDLINKIDIVRNLSRKELIEIGLSLRESIKNKFSLEKIEDKLIDIFL